MPRNDDIYADLEISQRTDGDARDADGALRVSQTQAQRDVELEGRCGVILESNQRPDSAPPYRAGVRGHVAFGEWDVHLCEVQATRNGRTRWWSCMPETFPVALPQYVREAQGGAAFLDWLAAMANAATAAARLFMGRVDAAQRERSLRRDLSLLDQVVKRLPSEPGAAGGGARWGSMPWGSSFTGAEWAALLAQHSAHDPAARASLQRYGVAVPERWRPTLDTTGQPLTTAVPPSKAPKSETSLRDAPVSFYGDSGAVRYRQNGTQWTAATVLSEGFGSLYEYPNLAWAARSGATVAEWVLGVAQETRRAVSAGVIRDGTRDKFPLARALIICDNLNSLSGVPQNQGKHATTPVHLQPDVEALYEKLFAVGGQRWHAPVYACADPAAVWGLHPTAEVIAARLRDRAAAHGWVVVLAHQHWADLGALRPPGGWHHKEETHGTRWAKGWDSFLSSILRVRELAVFHPASVDAVRARLSPLQATEAAPVGGEVSEPGATTSALVGDATVAEPDASAGVHAGRAPGNPSHLGHGGGASTGASAREAAPASATRGAGAQAPAAVGRPRRGATAQGSAAGPSIAEGGAGDARDEHDVQPHERDLFAEPSDTDESSTSESLDVGVDDGPAVRHEWEVRLLARLTREAQDAALPTMPTKEPVARVDAGDDAGATLDERVRRAMPDGVGARVAYFMTRAPTTQAEQLTRESVLRSLRRVSTGPAATRAVVESALTMVRQTLYDNIRNHAPEIDENVFDAMVERIDVAIDADWAEVFRLIRGCVVVQEDSEDVAQSRQAEADASARADRCARAGGEVDEAARDLSGQLTQARAAVKQAREATVCTARELARIVAERNAGVRARQTQDKQLNAALAEAARLRAELALMTRAPSEPGAAGGRAAGPAPADASIQPSGSAHDEDGVPCVPDGISASESKDIDDVSCASAGAPAVASRGASDTPVAPASVSAAECEAAGDIPPALASPSSARSRTASGVHCATDGAPVEDHRLVGGGSCAGNAAPRGPAAEQLPAADGAPSAGAARGGELDAATDRVGGVTWVSLSDTDREDEQSPRRAHGDPSEPGAAGGARDEIANHITPPASPEPQGEPRDDNNATAVALVMADALDSRGPRSWS